MIDHRPSATGIEVIVSLAVFAALCVTLQLCSRRADAYPAGPEEWENLLLEVVTGKHADDTEAANVEIKDMSNASCKGTLKKTCQGDKACKQVVDGYCAKFAKTLKQGLKDGASWCLDPESKCGKGVRARLAARWAEYCPDESDPSRCWWMRYAGGAPAAHAALTSITEAPAGVFQCSKDPVLKECGIMGLKLWQARACDVNACDPEGSMWCVFRLTNEAMIGYEDSHPTLKHTTPAERYVIMGLGGGIGSLAKYVIAKSGALSLNAAGDGLKYPSPYQRILAWLGSIKKPVTGLADQLIASRIKRDYKVGFRVGRWVAVMKHIEEFRGKPFAEQIVEPVLVPRPEGLATFPGEKNQGPGLCEAKYHKMSEKKP